METPSALLLGLFAVSAFALAEVDARMFRFPDVSESRITFVYAGDIWVVETQGSTARRLSSPPGEETFPRFSPDGSEIAFSGNYDGNTDVYVVATTGGEPRRITHHPLPIACSTGPRMGHGCSSPHVAKVAHSDLVSSTPWPRPAGCPRSPRFLRGVWSVVVHRRTLARLHAQEPRLPQLEAVSRGHGAGNLAV